MEQRVDITTLIEPTRPCSPYVLLAIATMEPTGIPIVMEDMQISKALSVRKLIYTAVRRGMTRRRITVII